MESRIEFIKSMNETICSAVLETIEEYLTRIENGETLYFKAYSGPSDTARYQEISYRKTFGIYILYAPEKNEYYHTKEREEMIMIVNKLDYRGFLRFEREEI